MRRLHMSQKPPPDQQSAQPAAPNSTHAETRSSLSIDLDPQVHTQESPLAVSTPRVSSPEPSHTTGILKVHHQEPSSTPSGRRVSIQEPLPSLSGRRVSIQEAPPSPSVRRVSIQEPPTSPSVRRVSIQEPPPSFSGRRVSIQEPPTSPSVRRISIQEPPTSLSGRRVSIQEALPSLSVRRVSIQEPLSILQSHQISSHESYPDSSHRRFSIQDTPSITYNSWVGAQDGQPNQHLSTSLTEIQSVSSYSQTNFENFQTIERTRQTFKQNRLSVDVPPSITHSPEASIKSIESIVWGSQESFKQYVHSPQLSQITLDNIHNYMPRYSTGIGSSRFQDKWSRQSLLPLGWRLLHEARKISRQLSLVLSLAGMVIISLISLGQPWMHFQVPLKPPGDPDGPQTIPINTIFFMQCPDVVCMYEYDQNAYLLDLSWAFLVISSITGFCLCVALISTFFFTSSNLPMLDFFLFISSIMTGASIILGVLFYLMQAHEFLQEGMTYKLGISFYLAWTAVFLFLMNGPRNTRETKKGREEEDKCREGTERPPRSMQGISSSEGRKQSR
uniref:uncharacterized protein LOC120887892 isoform X2 n=1 Tax=Ictidomys tridecemlineatus TaxID=43179 RepID=UPI001A9F2933|nr:uncharacterized protein LOC120887892 isoform X2 [Ictidomys tridecemlineatus]XP_040135137.1 uncharacterized protein LOC120887892 isoform X2 [Ictidomys tridecemlineatus]